MAEKKVARDVMTTEVLSVREDWPFDKVAEFFVENGISGAPQRSIQIGIKDIQGKRLRQHSTFILLPRCSKFGMSLGVRHAP